MSDTSTVAAETTFGLVTTAEIDSASQPYVGQWQRLVSTTNWEKGRIISNWRAALVASGAAVSEYSDEAWSRRVGGVSGQHVGRLRRVCERFGQCQENFAGLFWSHFQAALDWEDAEMWLEGAVQNGWSVTELRTMRWQTLHPGETAVLAEPEAGGDDDEDFSPAVESAGLPSETSPRFAEVAAGPRADGPDFGDADDGHNAPDYDFDPKLPPATALVQPFVNLAALPDDLAEAFEAFKLALLRHKAEGWKAISCDDALAALDALKQFAVAS